MPLLVLLNLIPSLVTVDVICENVLQRFPWIHPSERSCYVVKYLSLADGDHIQFPTIKNPEQIEDLQFLLSNRTVRYDIHKCPTDIFEFLPNLKTFVIQAEIKTIRPTDFQKATNLKKLAFTNRLEIVPAGVFSSLSSLEELDLKDNEIVTIEDGAFSGLEKIEFINLEDNKLVRIGKDSFVGAHGLSFLKLNYNQIKTIEDGALNFPHVIDIGLRHNKLTSLSDNLFLKMQGMRALSLDHNEITNVNNALYNLSLVSSIDLSSNKITDINLYKLGNMPTLKTVYLKESGFNFDSAFIIYTSETIPTESLINYLDISNNELTDSESIKKLSFLTKLNSLILAGNKLTCIDFGKQTFHELFPNLEQMYLPRNKWECGCLEKLLEKLKSENIKPISQFYPENIECL